MRSPIVPRLATSSGRSRATWALGLLALLASTAARSDLIFDEVLETNGSFVGNTVEVDYFRFVMAADGDLSLVLDSSFDPVVGLFLYDPLGDLGLLGNSVGFQIDAIGSCLGVSPYISLNPCLELTVNAGDYVAAVSAEPAVSSVADLRKGSDSSSSRNTRAGDYTLSIIGANVQNVPVAPSALLLLPGLLLLGATRARRRCNPNAVQFSGQLCVGANKFAPTCLT